jgi:hypothetical protein
MGGDWPRTVLRMDSAAQDHDDDGREGEGEGKAKKAWVITIYEDEK